MDMLPRHRVPLCLILICTAAAMAAPGLWLDVPYVKQPTNGCGAACASMVLQYWVRKDPRFRCRVPTVASIERELYSARDRGVPAGSLERYLRQKGMRVFTFRGDEVSLRHHLSRGRPLIVCLREGRGLDRTLHYVVVAGIEPGFVLVNDPALKKLALLRLGAFEQKWRAENNWTLLALPLS